MIQIKQSVTCKSLSCYQPNKTNINKKVILIWIKVINVNDHHRKCFKSVEHGNLDIKIRIVDEDLYPFNTYNLVVRNWSIVDKVFFYFLNNNIEFRSYAFHSIVSFYVFFEIFLRGENIRSQMRVIVFFFISSIL